MFFVRGGNESDGYKYQQESSNRWTSDKRKQLLKTHQLQYNFPIHAFADQRQITMGVFVWWWGTAGASEGTGTEIPKDEWWWWGTAGTSAGGG
ncbi:hypothetical protein N7468_007236 [Penicillium chermesinum]|uniref:Uncharacterized protein n=1 Tax=Penicillium chermesinum TaxID=63820 RepID=A0A9W9TKD1_9EURO|nr:uncharacterized protein N7468_007236 [Penicillium chermesinum]KAJ5226011.1 hypothetical protein N7468_007236 [Penicillium chermesinum]